LDADHPNTGVNFACRFTMMLRVLWKEIDVDRTRITGSELNCILQELLPVLRRQHRQAGCLLCGANLAFDNLTSTVTLKSPSMWSWHIIKSSLTACCLETHTRPYLKRTFALRNTRCTEAGFIFTESLDVAPEGWAILQPSLDDDAFASLELLKVLYEIDIGKSPLPLERQKTLYAEGPELISACVIELSRFTMTTDPKRSRSPPRALCAYWR